MDAVQSLVGGDDPGVASWDGVHVSVEPADLAPWVETIWYSNGYLDSLRERVLPSANCDIVANLGPPMWMHEPGGTLKLVGTTASGLHTRPQHLEHPAWHEAVGLRVTALGLRAILGVPASALRDLTVPLADVVESTIDELAERCAGAGSPDGALRAAVAWVRGRVARFAESLDPLVVWAARTIEAQHGATSMAALTERSGYGATRFNRRFVDELGLTPKKFARLVRFRRALDLLAPERSLADLALALGYADQAHMNRDFRTLGATTPSEVLASRYSSGITLAE